MAKEITAEIFFEAARLVDSLDLKNDIKDLVLQQENEKTKRSQESFGYDLIFTAVGKAVQKKSEAKIYDFLALVLERPAEDIRKQKMTELIDEVIAVIDIKEWQALFTRVAKLVIQN